MEEAVRASFHSLLFGRSSKKNLSSGFLEEKEEGTDILSRLAQNIFLFKKGLFFSFLF